MKRLVSFAICFTFLFSFLTFNVSAETPPLSVNAKSALLMEAETGTILYEHNIHEKLPPASITKIMTMLLAMDAIKAGQINYDTIVTGSERAKSMGGSTIYLDAGEQISVRDLLKGIAVASGNDACVAIAEHIAGSEEAFVEMMNQRAKELGMNDTHFVNTNGLDAEGHVTSAYDVALMSRELLNKHPEITEYTTIWIDSLRGGQFQLANTNKLIRFYPGANGLKTGSTSKALFCVSATAKRDNMQLIAVIMASPTSQERFNAARTLLDYGFANYAIAGGNKGDKIAEVKVSKGEKQTLQVEAETSYKTLVKKAQKSAVTTHIDLPEQVQAPIKKGDRVGEIKLTVDNEVIISSPLVACEDVKRISLFSMIKKILGQYLANKQS
ncbi:MAG: D-alanyl-D-alanine carboxypeptidase [Clostridiaceae bacterium]|nr:D-alanyl-D-alanine carboxypeptidase [Clostridiaceae bacterium]